jgi:membrane-bound lytic murein transglycosylase A
MTFNPIVKTTHFRSSRRRLPGQSAMAFTTVMAAAGLALIGPIAEPVNAQGVARAQAPISEAQGIRPENAAAPRATNRTPTPSNNRSRSPAQGASQPAGPGAMAQLRPIGFHELPGWAQEDFKDFRQALSINCGVMRQRAAQWASICRDAEGSDLSDERAIRQFVESRFTPHELSDAKGTRSATITGYYEPLLKGSRTRGGPYQIPLYRTPKDLVNVDLSSIYPEIKALRLRGRLEGNRVVPYPTRAEIETKGLLAGHELLWVDDPVEAFFLQVQGSGRVQLPNGESVRVGYAEQNGYPYRSIGKYLVEKGELRVNEASMQNIKSWVSANPHRRDELLHQNPSVVFFREIPNLNSAQGPLGSMGLPLTAGRSIAADPRFVTAGSLVYLSTRVPRPGAPPRDSGVAFQRLMIAQDTGSAILGAHRSDIFFGTGAEAGDVAGRMRSDGQLFVLLPNEGRVAQAN